jgi:glutamine synthetase
LRAQLVQQEPDASSFPNGELEILLKQEDTPLGILHLQRSFGEQHYVSQLFYLLHREALDYKTPLLRALQV